MSIARVSAISLACAAITLALAASADAQVLTRHAVSIEMAKTTERTPTKKVAAFANTRHIDSDSTLGLNGLSRSLTNAMDAELRKESADDITIEMTAAMTRPLRNGGNTVIATCGSGKFEFRLGSIVRATSPINPVTAKNGIENNPA